MLVIGDRRRDRNESEEESRFTLFLLTSFLPAEKRAEGGRDDVKSVDEQRVCCSGASGLVQSAVAWPGHEPDKVGVDDYCHWPKQQPIRRQANAKPSLEHYSLYFFSSRFGITTE